MPPDDLLTDTGDEWLLHILTQVSKDQQATTLMTLWRIGHAHNEMTYLKPCPSIEGSRRFLVSYVDSLLMIRQFPEANVVKGKMVLDHGRGFKSIPKEDGRQKVRKSWCPPEHDRAKLNVNGAFTTDGAAGSGMVLRNHMGG